MIMNSQTFELTLEQEFHVRLMEESAQNMSREQMQEMLLQTVRLLMIKENVIRDLVKESFI
jgi:Phycobilisome degradation protein nblA